VESGLAEADEELTAVLRESRLSIGGAEFRDKIKEMHDNLLIGRKRKEDALLRRQVGRLTTDQILVEVCRELKTGRDELVQRRRCNWTRPLAAMMLGKYGGLTQREVADEMRLNTGSAVSFQVRKLKGAMASDKHLLDTVSRIEKMLRARTANGA
jgi:hypothetical protein